jgi:hypothetical protein
MATKDKETVSGVTARLLVGPSNGDMRTDRTREADARCAQVLRGQHGLISLEQLAKEGLDASARRRRVKAGLLIPVLPGVFRINSTNESWRQFVLAAWMWLHGRGVLSHLTSARLLGLVESETYPVELSTSMPSLKAPDERVSVHRVKDLQSRDIRHLDDMRITTPLRTVFDLAGSLTPNRFEYVLDEARRRHLVAERPLRDLLDRCARQGRPGVKALRRLLDAGELRLPVPRKPLRASPHSVPRSSMSP